MKDEKRIQYRNLRYSKQMLTFIQLKHIVSDCIKAQQTYLQPFKASDYVQLIRKHPTPDQLRRVAR